MPTENVRTRSSATPSSSTCASAPAEPCRRSVVSPHDRPEAQVLDRRQILVQIRAVGHDAERGARDLGLLERIHAADVEVARGRPKRAWPRIRSSVVLPAPLGPSRARQDRPADLERNVLDHEGPPKRPSASSRAEIIAVPQHQRKEGAAGSEATAHGTAQPRGPTQPGGEKGPDARRRPKAAREAYCPYVERASRGRQRSRWALIAARPATTSWRGGGRLAPASADASRRGS